MNSVTNSIQRLLVLIAIAATGTSAASATTPTSPFVPVNAQPLSINWIYFDDLPAGSRISDEYASQGVRFLNDFAPNRTYRSSPQIAASAAARSGGQLLINTSYDSELFSSVDIPLVAGFDAPVTGVGMWIGGVNHLCSATATVTLLGEDGSQRGQGVIAADTTLKPLQVLVTDPSKPAYMMTVDFGSSTCNEAIDDFAFQTTTGACTLPSKPVVAVTSHTQNQIVNNTTQIIEGTVDGPGFVHTVKIDGVPVPVYYSNGLFHFKHTMLLVPGSNTITVLATNACGQTGSDQVTLMAGLPSSVAIAQFHLTQRGLMEDASCDVDTPLVAGKSAIVRLSLDVQASNGTPTYVDTVELRLYRNNGVSDVLVDTYWGTLYSPYASKFNTPNEMAAIHFWLDGSEFDTAGEYKFVFQPYLGLTPLGSALTANCGGTYQRFSETNPVRLFIMPAEAAITNPAHDSDHVKNYYNQLHTIARTYPVRDGYADPSSSAGAGVYYHESSPLRLCDGSAAMQQSFPDWCNGTGWTWRLIDRDPSGTLHRANHARTTDPADPTICDGRNDTLGGRTTSAVMTDAAHTIDFNPQIGLFRSGAHPQWLDIKYYIPIDEDHDGLIDTDDIGHFIGEFLDIDDSASPTWTTDLSKYDDGETYRFWVDTDGDQCQTRDENNNRTEAYADVVRLWENANTLAFGPAKAAMTAYNKQYGGSVGDFPYASLWFPTVVNPLRTDFGTWGPGSSRGSETWIRVTYDTTMAHELGHSLGGLGDLYEIVGNSTQCTLPKAEINPWAAYVDYAALTNVTDLWDVMTCSMKTPQQFFFNDDHYQALFDALEVSRSAAQTEISALSGEQIALRGIVYRDGRPAEIRGEPAPNLRPTAVDDTSGYELVFGARATELLVYPFRLEWEVDAPQGYADWTLPFARFEVIAPLPTGTIWIALRDRTRDEILATLERTTTPPEVTLLSPNGGASYAADDVVPVIWQADDVDTPYEELRFTLSYSPNGGENWTVIATGISGSALDWKLADTPGTPKGAGLMRIEVSDGFNSSSDISDGSFEVEGKRPSAVVFAPANDATFLECGTLQLQGLVNDPEQAIDQIRWEVGPQVYQLTPGPNQVPTVTRLEVPMPPPGVHVVALSVWDDQALSGEDMSSITVLQDSDCDGMSNAYEEANGLDMGFAGDADTDTDGDMLIAFEEAWRGTAASDPDSDGDGYWDGVEVADGSDPNVPDRIDVDGNGRADALTDGLLILRRLFGFSGETLVSGALAPDAVRTDAVVIAEMIDSLDGRLDLDANGAVDALTDGLLVLRTLFGFGGSALVQGALAPNALRTDPYEIAMAIEAMR